MPPACRTDAQRSGCSLAVSSPSSSGPRRSKTSRRASRQWNSTSSVWVRASCGPERGERLAGLKVLLAEAPLAVVLHEPGGAARHVHRLELRGADAVQRAHQRGARLVGATDQRLQPARLHEDVVVDEDDVRGLHVGEGQVPRFVGREVILDPDEVEPLRALARLDRAAHRSRRAGVHVHERERGGGALVEDVEGAHRHAEALAGDHDNGDRGCHGGAIVAHPLRIIVPCPSAPARPARVSPGEPARRPVLHRVRRPSRLDLRRLRRGPPGRRALLPGLRARGRVRRRPRRAGRARRARSRIPRVTSRRRSSPRAAPCRASASPSPCSSAISSAPPCWRSGWAPDGMHVLLSRFFELALAEVHRYEGTVNQFLGDGFMALFGAPIAHEDHARRAVLAALDIRRAVQRAAADAPVGRGVRAHAPHGPAHGLRGGRRHRRQPPHGLHRGGRHLAPRGAAAAGRRARRHPR